MDKFHLQKVADRIIYRLRKRDFTISRTDDECMSIRIDFYRGNVEGNIIIHHSEWKQVTCRPDDSSPYQQQDFLSTRTAVNWLFALFVDKNIRQADRLLRNMRR